MFKWVRKFKPALDFARVLGVWTGVAIQAIIHWGLLLAVLGSGAAIVGAIFHPSVTYPIIAGLLAFFSILGVTRELRLRTEAITIPVVSASVSRDTGKTLPARNYTKADRERLADAMHDVLSLIQDKYEPAIQAASMAYGLFSNRFNAGNFDFSTMQANLMRGDQLAHSCVYGSESFDAIARKYPAYASEFRYVLEKKPSIQGHRVPPPDILGPACREMVQFLGHLSLLSTSENTSSLNHLSHLWMTRFQDEISSSSEWGSRTKRRAIEVREKVLSGTV
jgi:hypothetical protein